ncbi:amidohydrolase [Saccharibacillus sp. CPCC 101409]|uniref:amidohydrolase n=1 Tax=Saccharibacillus sp. CPCC 101409 TaxID=3058041 RepID=UPI002673FD4C|nr:amidohydrolase [Saccharibacillus sp. CPCC 101409]MDO3409125.1 amidohydrolase [Saccharibacillus sp. CPCC 101409]
MTRDTESPSAVTGETQAGGTERSAVPTPERWIAIRRHLHRYPELSGEEYGTTAYLREQLEAIGVRIVDYGLKTGLIAEIGSGEGPIAALRADIDALPIQEETGLPYASVHDGRMHACGHDFHAAALIGAAQTLKLRESGLPGTVRLLFQPAEERAKGAKQLIEAGALKGVGAIIGQHNKPDLPVGTIGISAGPIMAASDGFTVTVKGAAAHAAVPEAGIDPIVTASHIVTALQTIAGRSIGAHERAVVSVTQIHAGNTWNVIPDTAVLHGTIRSFDEDVRRVVKKRFAEIAGGVAAAFGAEASVRWSGGPPPVVNDAELARLAEASAESLGLKAAAGITSPASEDFSFYQREVPGLFLFVGTSGSREWHHPAFELDEAALPDAAALLADAAVRALEHLGRKAD